MGEWIVKILIDYGWPLLVMVVVVPVFLVAVVLAGMALHQSREQVKSAQLKFGEGPDEVRGSGRPPDTGS